MLADFFDFKYWVITKIFPIFTLSVYFFFTFSSISVRNMVTPAMITKRIIFPIVGRNIAAIPNTLERK